MSHWHEGAGEGTVPECSRVIDRPFRRRCRELCPAVFGSTEADWGDQAHHAPEETRCCFHSGCSPSACSSPWAPPCGRPRSHAAAAAFHRAASWSRSHTGRPARPGPRQTRRQVQEALRRATQRWRELLIGRWWPHHSLPRRRAGWRILCFVLFLFHRWPSSQRYPKLQ